MTVPRTRVFLAGQSVSLLGDGLAVLAVPLLVLHLTRSPVLAALAAAPRTVGYLAVGLIAGPIVDRMDARRLMIAMDAVRAVAFIAMYAIASANTPPVWCVLAVAFAAGGAGVFFETALMAAVKAMFTPESLIGTNSVLELASQVARVAGPGAVGVLAMTVGVRTALLVDASTFVLSMVTVYLVRPDPPRPAVRGTSPRGADAGQRFTVVRAWFTAACDARHGLVADLREGLRYIITTRVLLTIGVLQVVVNFALGSEKLVIFYATDTLSLPAVLVSLVVLGGGVGGVLGALGARRAAAWLGPLRLIVGGVGLTGVSFALLGVAGPALPVAYAVMLCAQTAVGVVNRSMRLRIVPRELTGRVFSTMRLAYGGVDPIGAAIAGALTGVFGGDPRPVFLGAGLTVAVAAAVAWSGGLRRRPDP